MASAKKAEAETPAENEELQLPALPGATAKERAESLVPAVKDFLHMLPDDLVTLMRSRFILPSQLDMPDLPMTGNQTSLDVSWVKVINPLTQNKQFNGEQQIDGTVLGKTVLYKPGTKGAKPFPFIVLSAWEERLLGAWDSQKQVMNTRCSSRDGVVPSIANPPAKLCEECPHDTRNRPKYDKDPGAKTERCKKSVNLIGIGGDFQDFYVITIKGPSIIDVYSKGFAKELRGVAQRGLPWYSKMFFLHTVQDGTFWGLEIANVLNTVPTPQSPDPDLAYWSLKEEDPENSLRVTFQVLEQLHQMADMYKKELQARARESAEKQQAAQETIQAPVEGDDEDSQDVGGGGTEGLD